MFCGAGGASAGYESAGFEVRGVDIKPQPNYPFPFTQGDALEVMRALIKGYMVDGMRLSDFDAIHASPPCQSFTAYRRKGHGVGEGYPNLIPETRELLIESGKPYIIENVAGAPLDGPVMLCGSSFELGGWSMPAPEHKPHRGRVAGYRHGEWFEGPYFAVYGNGGGKGSLEQWQDAMGIGWMHHKHDLAESIPPAYTQYIGEGLAAHFKQEVAA